MVGLWDLRSGQRQVVLGGGQPTGEIGAVTADRRALATGAPGGIIKLWDLPSGRERWTSLAHRSRVESLAFTRDARTLASLGHDGTIKLWHTATGQELFTLSGEPHTERVAFSPDGRALYAGINQPAGASRPGELRMWRTDPAAR